MNRILGILYHRLNVTQCAMPYLCAPFENFNLRVAAEGRVVSEPRSTTWSWHQGYNGQSNFGLSMSRSHVLATSSTKPETGLLAPIYKNSKASKLISLSQHPGPAANCSGDRPSAGAQLLNPSENCDMDITCQLVSYYQ